MVKVAMTAKMDKNDFMSPFLSVNINNSKGADCKEATESHKHTTKSIMSLGESGYV